MEKIITAIFDSEENAFKASQAIGELTANKDISLTELYVLARNDQGEVVIKNAKNEVVSYTASGALAGSLIGLLGGPLGVLFGFTTGVFAGGIGDIIRQTQSAKFLKKASASVPPGKTAIIAHVNEYWETPLDTTLKPFDAEIRRLNVNEEIERFIVAEQKELHDEIGEVSAKLEKATGDEKEKLDARLARLQARAKELKEEIHQETEAGKNKLSAWFENAKTRFSNWKADIADRFDERKEDLIEDYEDLEEDYRELSNDIQSGLRLLTEGSESSFRKAAGYIGEKIDELNEDIAELELAIEKLGDDSKKRWQAKLATLKTKKDELLIRSKEELEKYRAGQERWLEDTQRKIGSGEKNT